MSSKLERIRQLSQRTMKRISDAVRDFERGAEKLVLDSDTEDAMSYHNEAKAKAGSAKQLMT